ncbi:MAG: BrnA antitoxin family protein [Gammaproteobacteria bacterium]
MPKLKPGTIHATPEEDAAITAAAMDDPDALPYTDEEWAKVKPRRGRPAQDITKVPMSIRLDARVVDAFKATGDGWQTRMNDALLEYAQQHHMLTP